MFIENIRCVQHLQFVWFIHVILLGEGEGPSKKWMKAQYVFSLVFPILVHWLVDGNSQQSFSSLLECVHKWALVDTDKALCGFTALYLFSVPFVILTISVIWTKNFITITELGKCRNLQEQIYVRWFLFPKILLAFDDSGWRIKVVACCTWFLIPFASFNLRWC